LALRCWCLTRFLYRDKEVVGVFVPFSCAASPGCLVGSPLGPLDRNSGTPTAKIRQPARGGAGSMSASEGAEVRRQQCRRHGAPVTRPVDGDGAVDGESAGGMGASERVVEGINVVWGILTRQIDQAGR
jgi:hypothetical protein